MTPTIVLVHGAFAESSSWDAVIDPLQDAGHPVITAANPLRGLAADAAAVADVVRAVDGPVVLAAHSYGGAVISNVPADAGEIVGLVYVNGFAPESGEHCFQLAGMFPGSRLGEETARPVSRTDGTTDLYVVPESFRDIFCQDVPAPQAALMAITQRPATQEALTEPSGDPLWKDVPSWFLIGEEDRIIPAELQRYMAERAHARRTVADRGCVARYRRLASRRDGASDPRGRGAARGRLTRRHATTTTQRNNHMSITTHAAVVLEPESQAFVEATSKPPFLYELTPAEARKVLDDVQAASDRQAAGRGPLDHRPGRGRRRARADRPAAGRRRNAAGDPLHARRRLGAG